MTVQSRLAAALMPLAFLVAGTLVGCNPEPPPPPEPGPSVSGTTVRFNGRPEGIRTEPVQDAGNTTLTLPGRLVWDEDVTVRVFTPFSGRLIKPLVQVGDRVRAGQELAEMASSDFSEAMADARRAETDGKLARDSLARLRELHGAGLVARKELIEAQALASRSAIERQRTQNRLAQVGASGGGLNFVLRAPIDGVVVDRSVNPGQELRADQGSTPLFVITDPTRLWAWFDAPESALPRLAAAQPGTPMQITSGAWGNRVFDASLRRKDDAIDPTARSFRLRAEVENPDRSLKAEMFVTATLSLPDDSGGRPVGHVPTSAVLLVDGRRQVFVQDGDNGFTRVEVDVIRELPGRVGVTGLTTGQRVVVEGNLYLQQILSRADIRAAKTEAKR